MQNDPPHKRKLTDFFDRKYPPHGRNTVYIALSSFFASSNSSFEGRVIIESSATSLLDVRGRVLLLLRLDAGKDTNEASISKGTPRRAQVPLDFSESPAARSRSPKRSPGSDRFSAPRSCRWQARHASAISDGGPSDSPCDRIVLQRLSLSDRPSQTPRRPPKLQTPHVAVPAPRVQVKPASAGLQSTQRSPDLCACSSTGLPECRTCSSRSPTN